MEILNGVSLIGLAGLCLVAWLLSEQRRRIPWNLVAVGLGLQLLLGLCVFVIPGTQGTLQALSQGLNALFEAAAAGARFVFGRGLVPPTNQPEVSYSFAFRALPSVIFASGFLGLLQAIGVMPALTRGFARLFYPNLRLSGAESLSTLLNSFLGIEAVIAIRPDLAQLTRSELVTILAAGFSTAASSTWPTYTSLLKSVFPNILAHLVAASLLAVPASWVLAKIVVPETDQPYTSSGIPELEQYVEDETEEPLPPPRMTVGEQAISASWDGLKIAASIAAMLILVLGLVSLLTQTFAWLATLPDPVGHVFQVLSLGALLGLVFFPLTALMGVSLDPQEIWQASVLVGRRLIETAVPAYQTLAQPLVGNLLGDRALVILSYSLSGFANLAAVGLFVGGIAALMPQRRREIVEVVGKAFLVGTLATLMVGAVAGVFYTPNRSEAILGRPAEGFPPPQPAPALSPSSEPSPSASPSISPSASPAPSPSASPNTSPSASPSASAKPSSSSSASPSPVPPRLRPSAPPRPAPSN